MREYVVVHKKKRWEVVNSKTNETAAVYFVDNYINSDAAEMKAYAKASELITLDLAKKLSKLPENMKQQELERQEMRKSKYKKSLNDEVNF